MQYGTIFCLKWFDPVLVLNDNLYLEKYKYPGNKDHNPHHSQILHTHPTDQLTWDQKRPGQYRKHWNRPEKTRKDWN